MGICYTILMHDDFDWGYVGADKEAQLNQFQSSFAVLEENSYPIERVATWYGWAVFDVDKQWPYSDARKALILDYCDYAYVIDDCENIIRELK